MLNVFQFSSLPLKPQQFLGPLCLCLLASLAVMFNSDVINIGVYHHNLISQWELWRLISGHLLHTNLNHYLLNVAAVILLWALHGHFYQGVSYLKLFVFCCLICSAGMFYLSPQTSQYVGLSGALHGVFVWGVCKDIAAKDKTGYLLLLGVIIKLAHEQLYGASSDIAELISAPVAIDAHLWGALAGATYFLLSQGYSFSSVKS